MATFTHNLPPMHLALCEGDFDYARQNFDPKDTSPLYHALELDSLDVFKEFYLMYPTEMQQQYIARICQHGERELLDFALTHVNFDFTNPEIHSHTCMSGNLDLVKYVESLGAAKDEWSFNHALQSNSLPLVEYLWTPDIDVLENLPQHYQIDNIELLRWIASKCTLPQYNLNKMLLHAVTTDNLELIDYLCASPELSVHAEINGIEDAAFDAVYYGRGLETLKYLLTSPTLPIKADISANHYDAFTWAYDHGYEDIVDYLVHQHHITPDTSIDVYNTMQKDNFELYHRVTTVKEIKSEHLQMSQSVEQLNLKKGPINKV